MKMLDGVNKISLYGAGKSNAALSALLKRSGWQGELTLRSDRAVTREEYENIRPDILLCGKAASENFHEDIAFISPSVKTDVIPKKEGLRICTDVELFFEERERRAIGITGSDGKSTTTYLISEILRASGIDASPLGNFGTPFSSFFDSNIFAVAELSSFQLTHYTPKLLRAVITNVTENHLDWHGSMKEYVRAKLSIFARAEKIVYDADSEILKANLPERRAFCITSSELPLKELQNSFNSENFLTLEGTEMLLNGEHYIDVSGAKRREEYNIKNYMLAAAATLGLVTKDAVLQTILNFKGLKHRSELLFSENGIDYIDSSVDSSPERSARTLDALRGDIVAITGGRGKGLSLAPLCDALLRKCKGAVVLGEVGDALLSGVAKDERFASFRIRKATDMKDAVAIAKNMLGGSGTVILTPAATSFDKYKNFEERAADFENACRALSKKEI